MLVARVRREDGLKGRLTVRISLGRTGYHEAGVGTGDLSAIGPNVGQSTGECYASLRSYKGVDVDVLRPGSGTQTGEACQCKAI
jgi:hypothetical protein